MLMIGHMELQIVFVIPFTWRVLYIVTGAGRRLGVALAGALVEAGAHKVYCLDILAEPHEGWFEMRKRLSGKGDRLVFQTQNVSDEEGVEAAFAEVVKKEGRLDGLVCAAVPHPTTA
jgi:NAD(P)-dependent dehydrogenase (short-subunit alcohol dehydrogenase family)